MTSIERLNLSGPLRRRVALAQMQSYSPKNDTFEDYRVDDRIYSGLHQLPNLPSCTAYRMKRECNWLENYVNKVIVWTSGETGFTSINCLRLAEDEDCEISEVSLLDIHTTQRHSYRQIHRSEGFHFVYPQTRIPEWFSHQRDGHFVTIQLPADLYNNIYWWGIAVCAIFEVYEHEKSYSENLNDVSPGQNSKYFHEFKCLLDMDGVRVHCSQVFNLSKDKYKAGSFGFWLYIKHTVLRNLLDGRKCGNITLSITTDSPGVEIKKCGARVLFWNDENEFFENLERLIPMPKLLPSIENIAEVGCTSPQTETIAADTSRSMLKSWFKNYLQKISKRPVPMPLLPSTKNIAEVGCTSPQTETIAADTSGNPSLFFISLPYRNGLCGSTESRSRLKSWFKNYLQGFYNKRAIFNHFFPQSEIPEWFCHHNSPSDSVTIQQLPCFYNDPDWMGFAFCAIFLSHKHPTAVSKNLNLEIPPRFMCHLETNLDLGGMSPLLEHIMDEDEEEVLISLNQRAFIWVSFIPCGRVLSHISSQCNWVRFSFRTDSPDLLSVNCGVNLVYKQNMEYFTGTIVQCVTSYVGYLYSLRSSCDKVFHEEMPFYHDNINRIDSSYEDLIPQVERLSVDQPDPTTCPTIKMRYQKIISLLKNMLGRN